MVPARAASPLPSEVERADRELVAILAEWRFMEFIDPVNAAQARAAFVAGAVAPPFEYRPATWADSCLAALGRVRAPADHPVGRELLAAADEARAFVIAVRDRSAEAFARHASAAGYDTPSPATTAPGLPTPSNVTTPKVPFEAVVAELRAALRTRGLAGWAVTTNGAMSARVLVDAPRREIQVNPRASYRVGDLPLLVAHEVDVHAARAESGRGQRVRALGIGLPGALAVDEGLALLAEDRAGGVAGASRWRAGLLAEAVDRSLEFGFREVYESFLPKVGPEGAWTLTVRAKRGLRRPDLPGAFAKDRVYALGLHRVRGYLEHGGSLAHLYVGKVGLQVDVATWVAEGWVDARPVPPIWLSRPR